MGLSISVMNNPLSEWNEKKGDRYTNLNIDSKEMEELYFNVLNVPKWETYISGEDMDKYYERQEKLFKENISDKGYKMLGKIWDYYQDAHYHPSEINQLLKECLEIQKKTKNLYALSMLEKLILACREALEIKGGVFLGSD